jgi:hypothetical protein
MGVRLKGKLYSIVTPKSCQAVRTTIGISFSSRSYSRLRRSQESDANTIPRGNDVVISNPNITDIILADQ